MKTKPPDLLARLNALPDGTTFTHYPHHWLLHTHIRNATGQLRPRYFNHPDLLEAISAAEQAIQEATQ